MDSVFGITLPLRRPYEGALLFFAYGFAGWCFETALFLAQERRWVNRGFLTGPVLPIYGFGALLILSVCLPLRESMPLVLLVGSLCAVLLEYATGAAMERLFHIRYWDYSAEPLNWNGYVCAMSAAAWGVASVLVVRVIHPLLAKGLGGIPAPAGRLMAFILTGFALCDLGFAVRRASALRELLLEMERYAAALAELYGGLGDVDERLVGCVRGFSKRIGASPAQTEASIRRLTEEGERVEALMREQKIDAAGAAERRFAAMKQLLSETASDTSEPLRLDEEIEHARCAYERHAQLLRSAVDSYGQQAARALRRNPRMVSARHGEAFSRLRRSMEEERKKAGLSKKRQLERK